MEDKQENKEQVVHPSHYNMYDREVIDMMCDIWGPEEVAIWCKLSAFKYRMRAGHKNDIKIDIAKENECLALMRKYKELSGSKNMNLKADITAKMLCD